MSAQRTSLTRFLEKKKNYLSKRLTYMCILYSFQPITMQDFLHCKLSIVIFNQTVKLEEMEKKAGNAEGEVSALRSRLILLQVNFQSLSLNGKFSLYLLVTLYTYIFVYTSTTVEDDTLQLFGTIMDCMRLTFIYLSINLKMK